MDFVLNMLLKVVKHNLGSDFLILLFCERKELCYNREVLVRFILAKLRVRFNSLLLGFIVDKVIR
jgi:hypothetical protein